MAFILAPPRLIGERLLGWNLQKDRAFWLSNHLPGGLLVVGYGLSRGATADVPEGLLAWYSICDAGWLHEGKASRAENG